MRNRLGGCLGNRRSIKAVTLILAFLAMSIMLIGCGEGSGHKLTKHDATEATCIQEGNSLYYECSHCDKLFADEKGQTEIKLADVKIAKIPHTITDNDYHAAVASSCTQDGTFSYWECSACGKKFSDKAGKNELTVISDPAAHALEHFDRVEPTIDSEGNVEYWKCTVCDEFFLDINAEQSASAEELVIAKLNEYSVALSVALKDKAGEDVTDYTALANERIQLVLTDKSYNKTYTAKIDTDGSLVFVTVDAVNGEESDALSKMGEGKYKAVINGYYYESSLTIANSSTAQNKTIYFDEIEHDVINPNTAHPEYISATRSEDGEHSFIFNTPWQTDKTNAVVVDLQDDAIVGESYLVDFTVKTSDYKTDWTSRFYISAADSTGTNVVGYGIIFGNNEDKLILVHTQADKDFGGVPYAHKLNGVDGHYDSGAMVTALRSDAGLKMRVVRNGRAVSFLAYLSSGWEVFHTLSLAGDYGAKMSFAVTAEETITFSSISFGTFVAQTDPEVEKTGTEAHFKKDAKFYDVDGLETTESNLVIAAIKEIDIKFDLILKNESDVVAAPASLEVKLLPARGKTYAFTAVNGVLGTKSVGKGLQYTVKVEGYYDITIEVTDETTALELVLYKIQSSVQNPNAASYLTVTRDENEKEVYAFNAPWGTKGSNAVIVDLKNDAISGQQYLADFTVKASDYKTDWMSRFYIAVAGSTGANQIGYGFVFCGDENDNDKISMMKLDSNYDFGGMVDEYKLNGADGRYNSAAMIRAIQSANGLQLRIIRNDRSVTFLAYVNNGWETFRTLTLAGDYDARLAFAVTANETITFSKVSYGTYIATSRTDEQITLSHFAKDNKCYLADGSEVSQSELVVPVLASATLKFVDENGVSIIESGTQITLTNSSLGTASATADVNGILTFANKVVAGYTYTGSVNGFKFNVTFTAAETEVSKTLAVWKFSGAEGEVSDAEFSEVVEKEYVDYTYDKDGVTVVANWSEDWRRNGAIINPGSAYGELKSYTIGFNLKVEFNYGWTDRFGIRVLSTSGANGDVGYVIWNKDSEGIQIGALNNDMNVGVENPGNKLILTEAMLKAGIDMQIIVGENKATLQAKVADEWVTLHTITFVDAATPQLGFYAAGGTYSYTNISITALVDSVATDD